MHNDDGMDLESMLNNPFRNLEKRENPALRTKRSPDNEAAKRIEPARPKPDMPASRVERNHPMELRVLSLEKNEFNTSRKIDDIKHIIEHQNERIRLLEEELELLRNEGRNREK
jgi:hypothetical protein